MAAPLVSAPAAAAAPMAFSNINTIAISAGPAAGATPYPATITVAGVPGTVTSLSVGLKGLSHTFPNDLGAVLVAPNGTALKIIDGAGSGGGSGFVITNVDLTLADDAATLLPNNAKLVTGAYRPASYYNSTTRVFPAGLPAYALSAPLGSATLASSFNGINPNGTWSLYVRDSQEGDGGSIAGGWSLTIDSGSSLPQLTPTPTTSTSTAAPGTTTLPVISPSGKKAAVKKCKKGFKKKTVKGKARCVKKKP